MISLPLSLPFAIIIDLMLVFDFACRVHLTISRLKLISIYSLPKQRDRSASIGSIPLAEQNRTMVFLIGKTDLRLISPDRKQVLLYKDLKDVASCAQGHKNGDHFGIICREHNSDGYIGYVFKCQSGSVADEIVNTISQAFLTCSKSSKSKENQIFSCEHCPMLWYHKLCADIEGMSEKKTQTLIFRRIDMLSEEEQNVIMAKYYGAEEMADHGVGEQNQFLMMLLRAHCESRQQRHVHDTAENRSEFLNQYLGGSTIFMKAKRSLTSSFDHLLKRKNSKDDFASTVKEMQLKVSKLGCLFGRVVKCFIDFRTTRPKQEIKNSIRTTYGREHRQLAQIQQHHDRILNSSSHL